MHQIWVGFLYCETYKSLIDQFYHVQTWKHCSFYYIYIYILFFLFPFKYGTGDASGTWNWLVDGFNPYLLNLDAACSFVLDCELSSSSSPSVSLSSESSCHHHNKNDWAQRIQRLQSTNLVFIFRLVVIFHIKTKTKHIIFYFSIPPSPNCSSTHPVFVCSQERCPNTFYDLFRW